MTYKELLIKDHPELSNGDICDIITDHCTGCYYDGFLPIKGFCSAPSTTCEDCWNRDVPDDKSSLTSKHVDPEEFNNFIEKSETFIPDKDSNNVPHILDSGNRREFETGAVRDMKEGKGDMVSLPNAAILRLSKHYEAGARKYGRWNYTKGIPVSAFMDSALRHIFKYLDGWDDEDHLSAAAFNILGAMEMEEKHKELIDIPTREGKNTFDYKSNTGFTYN